MALQLDARARRDLRSTLEDRPGVERTFVDDDAPVLWLVCNPDADHPALTVAARDALAAAGVDPDAVEIRIAVHGSTALPRRVRFERVERLPQDDGSIRVRVRLAWRGETFTGEATAQVGGEVIEVRTGAAAALDALERLVGQSLGLRLIGVKAVRAFDEEFMVASLYHPEPPVHRYVGAVLVSSTPLVAVVLAVLNAVNRMLGNYLRVND